MEKTIIELSEGSWINSNTIALFNAKVDAEKLFDENVSVHDFVYAHLWHILLTLASNAQSLST